MINKTAFSVFCAFITVGTFGIGVFIGALKTGTFNVHDTDIRIIYSSTLFFFIGFITCIVIDLIESGNTESRKPEIKPEQDEHKSFLDQ